ncbi:UDP-N-acetylmuramoyl-tripeptide--D-alanyl-D-alanine ligase [Candidatus Cyrtobacter comes]|uniref:UDP-N-acetylmuramoyl-tripeptide--D-alanyl-D-alanine ligase n=1 Tax=Candidatus Cyrtobacter comes TaxID=675776 RepID=A0ABU5L9B3_9RICK|nr:UDP-N-acetylmuramoyl-tripeptide--D-alanyl-D-alanine ligase [Candidatus Cyrtobacter comes]MDZ5762711.1 UDP-N-acetylmuramoyl-tripeptide--D-alanyl-D-alanine ligase [Candidatus Cyrtobacter comes]
MPIWDTDSICIALGLDVSCISNFTGVSINTEAINAGGIFIGIKGKNVDGGIFWGKALEKGAALCIVNQDIEAHGDNIIKVQNTHDALIKLAEYKRNHCFKNVKVLGVTGSVGKTTIKNIISELTSKLYNVHFSKGNFNNHYGMPLSLANCPNDADLCILEMGMSASGEISFLSKIAKPDIAIISCIAPAHLAQFNSIEEIARAKAEIIDGMNDGGYVILNADDEYSKFIRQLIETRFNILTFGKKGDFKIEKYEFDGSKTKITLNLLGQKRDFLLNGFISEHLAENILCAFAAIYAAQYEIDESFIDRISASHGRGHIIKTPSGAHIIDDSYNASPLSVKAAIKGLSVYAKQLSLRSIAILGDMKELGKDSESMHREIAQQLILNNIDFLFTIGELMEFTHSEVITRFHNKNLIALHFQEMDSLINTISGFLSNGDVALVKGSNSMKMHKIVDYLSMHK